MMKIDPWYIFLAKIYGTVILAVIVGGLAAYLFIVVGVVDDGPDGYYTYHPQSGYIIGKNESRMVFYVEMNATMKTVHVDGETFTLYSVGDYYEWVITRFHGYIGITNLTMIYSWG